MTTSFSQIRVGQDYSRNELAELWGYAGFHALARGVVTPRDDDKIILFVTEQKQDSAEPYEDLLAEGVLKWEGPKDHFAEERMLSAKQRGEEIHLFHRERHHSDFVYLGMIDVIECERLSNQPSRFVFRLQHKP